MKRRLTEAVVNQKAPKTGTLVITDTLLPGWQVRIGKNKRSYSVRRRIGNADPIVRRPVKISVATTPEKEARQAAGKVLDLMAAGIDPEDVERQQQREAEKEKRETFTAVTTVYMAEHGARLKSCDELQRKLDKEILPVIGKLPIRDVGRADVKKVLRRKEGLPVAANRLLALMRSIMRYAEDEGLVDAVPSFRKLAQEEAPRERALSRAEIKSFWLGLDEAKVEPQLRHALKFCLVTGQRRSEVLLARWDECDFETGYWEIPGSRTKNGRTHRVPLPPLALELLDDMAEWTAGARSDYVFANGGGEPFAGFSLSQAMRRSLGVMGLEDAPATVHDLRRSFASGLGELGISRLIVGKLLNHTETGVTGRHYDKFAYGPEKTAAMGAWSDRLTEIVVGRKRPENVIAFKESA